MTEAETSPESAALGYTGCEVYRAQRVRRNHAVRAHGAILTIEEAIAERIAGRDVVVCGPTLKTNIIIAEKIESAVTGNRHQLHRAHMEKGPKALSHFQHFRLVGKGHTFFESPPDRLAMKGSDQP